MNIKFLIAFIGGGLIGMVVAFLSVSETVVPDTDGLDSDLGGASHEQVRGLLEESSTQGGSFVERDSHRQSSNHHWEGATELEAWFIKIESLRSYLQGHPELWIPEFKLLGAEDWLSVSGEYDLEVEADYRYALSQMRKEAKRAAMPILSEALRLAIGENGGNLPDDVAGLAKYLPSSLESSVLDRYVIDIKLDPAGEHPLVERRVNDPLWDWRTYIGERNNAIFEPIVETWIHSLKTAVGRYKSEYGVLPVNISQVQYEMPSDAVDSALAMHAFRMLTTPVEYSE